VRLDGPRTGNAAETERLALEALEEALRQGQVRGWWMLPLAASHDKDYAAVTATDRCQQLYALITERVAAMRESYQTNPGLPQETLRQARLLQGGI